MMEDMVSIQQDVQGAINVQEAITRNLSVEVGTRLKELLAQGEKDAEKVKRLEEQLAANAKLIQQQGEVSALSKKERDGLAKVVADYEKREQAILDAEHQLALAALKEECALLRVQDMKEMAALVFRNTKFKYSEFGSENAQRQVNTGSYVQSLPESVSKSRTVETQEE